MRPLSSVAPFLAAALVLLSPPGAGPVLAQDSALVEAFRANRLPLRFEGPTLAGAGGELLLREARAAQFTLVGEEHGVREVPQLVERLLNRLRDAGYRHVAIEVSPLAALRLRALARTGTPRAVLDSLFRDRSNWVPFYTMPPEAGLLAWALDPSAGGYDVWGLDYDIMGDRYWLPRLESLAPPEGRPAVAAARALADSGFARALRGDPSRVFTFSAPESVFTALRAAVAPQAGSEAERIIDVLATTTSINRDFLSGRNYESNEQRATNLKTNFLRVYDAAVAGGEAVPKVLFKFGAYHMERGLNGVRQYDVGWLAAAIAEAAGRRSFHVLLAGGPASDRAQFDPTSFSYKPQPAEMMRAEWMAAPRRSVAAEGFTLFDLRPIRALIQNRRLRDVPPQLERSIFGFDVLVVLTGSGPSTD